MCRLGDIILIRRYEHHGVPINNHSFVVIEDSGGQIEGVPFDFIGNVFHHLSQRIKNKRSFHFLEILKCLIMIRRLRIQTEKTGL